VKLILLFSILTFSSFSQTDTIKIKKILNYFPSISGIQFGNIPFWKLCNSEGIKTEADSYIISFDFQYRGKYGIREQHIAGNRIPDSVCTHIATYGLNNMILFTNIKAIDPFTGKVLHLTSMNLTPINEDE